MSHARRRNRLGSSILPLNVECLEDRQMLAGDVEAFAIGTVLHIQGDAADNGVLIRTSSEGVIEVLGFGHDETATTINELSSQTFIKIKEIVVTLGDGNDALVVTDLELSGSISVQLGKGDDILALGDFDNTGELVNDDVDELLGGVTIGNTLIVDMNDDNDTIVGRDTTAKLMTIFTGKGVNSLTFDRNGEPEDLDFVPGVTATKGMTINATSGECDIVLEGIAAQSLSITSDEGPDLVSLKHSAIEKGVKINVNDGANEVEIEDVIAKSISVSAGIGNDQFSMKELVIAGKVSVSDNFGDDTVLIEDMAAKSVHLSMGKGIDDIDLTNVVLTGGLDIDAGDGDDLVALIDIIAKSLVVSLGDGNDELVLDNVAITKTATISGGTGDDEIDIDRFSAASLKSSLGDGADEISFGLTIIAKKTTLDGGKGENTLVDDTNNDFGTLKVKNFPV